MMNRLVHLVPMAKWLGVSPAWLREEAEAGRIPCLNAAGVLLFNARSVQRVLGERAAEPHSAKGINACPV